MKTITTKINRTLFELEVGILIFGVFCQVIIFLFPKDKPGSSIGLWIGILTALFAAFHMWWSLDKGLDLPEKGAVSYLSRQNMIRYLVICVVLMLTAIAGAGRPLWTFLGIMGLKASAYMQFLTKKISRLLYGEEILPPIIEEPAGEQDK